MRTLVKKAPLAAGDISSPLIAWFEANKRTLAWRTEARDPYAVWVSEVMLQQTRVSTVVPYYARFLARFPTVGALAQASLDEVLAHWSGLGYYRRARALHAGAQVVSESWNGQMPPSYAELKTLPGVGDYTSAAIASLAYAEAVAVVDGNVRRVLARLFAMKEPADMPSMKRVYDKLANSLIPKADPGRFNEAMMELGALVCTPRSPHCDACPLSAQCEAKKQRLTDSLPVLAKKGAVPTLHLTMVLAETEGKLLLARRRPHGLFGGLWEPPAIMDESEDEADAHIARLFEQKPSTRGHVKHVLTHRIMNVRVVKLSLPTHRHVDALTLDAAVYDNHGLFCIEDLKDLGISTLAKKAIKLR